MVISITIAMFKCYAQGVVYTCYVLLEFWLVICGLGPVQENVRDIPLFG